MVLLNAQERSYNEPDLIGEQDLIVNPYKRRYTKKTELQSSLLAKAAAAADSIN